MYDTAPVIERLLGRHQKNLLTIEGCEETRLMNISIPSRTIRGLLMAMSVCMLAACGPSEEELKAQADAEAAARAAAKARIAKQAAAADPTSAMAHAVVVGKSQAVMDLKYEISQKPMVGEPIEIELAFIPLYPGDSINATISSSNPGFTLDGNLTPSVANVKAGEPWRVKLTAHAVAPTAYYFNVSADHNAAGVRSTRNFAIPLFVASPVTAEAASAQSSSSASKR